jgi:acetolactate synthase regulatory subunit
MTDKATARPWELVVEEYQQGKVGRLIRTKSYRIARVYGIAHDSNIADANADLIVTAVNSYDAMREALEKIVATYEYTTPAHTTNCRHCDNNMDHEGTYEDMHAPDCVIHDVRAALATPDREG